MKAKFYLLLTLLLATINTSSAFQEGEDYKILFEKAVYSMETKADLKEAITLFDSLIRTYPDEREYAANAQFHIGLCYEKLGNQQAQKAQKAYKEVIQHYGDQKEVVAIARERLSRLVLLAEKTANIPLKPKFTKIKTPSILSQNAATSPDGQQLLLVYDKKLWTMPLSGNLESDIPGIPIKLNTDSVKVTWAGLSWSGDGKTIAFNEIKDISSQDIPEKKKKNQIIYILSAEGGKPKRILENYCGPRVVSFRMSLSPDGKTLAYSSVNDDKMNIFSIPVDGGMPRKLVESPAREPVFSPDGKMIAYVEDKALGRRGGALWTVPALGGMTTLIAEAGNASSPVWSPDASNIAFIDSYSKTKINIIPVNKEGKPAGKKTVIDAPEGTDAIQLLTGWDRNNKIGIIIYRVNYALYTFPAEGGQAAMVYRGDASQPRWTPDGKHILFRKAAGQKAEGWPNDKLTVIPADGGKERNILTGHDDKMGFMPYGMGNKLSPNGVDIVFSAKKTDDDTVYIGHHPTRQIWRTSISGKKLAKITNPPVPYSDDCPCWSPDGKSIAFIRTKLMEGRGDLYGEMGIYIINSSGGAPKCLTLEPEKFIYSINWSPDGKWIAYLKEDKHSSNDIETLNVINVENGISRVVGEVSFTVHTELAWSPDSKRIAFNDRKGKVIKVMSLSDGSIEDIETGLVDVEVFHLDWSPDGKRFVFVGFQGGVPEYWVLEDFLPLEKLAPKPETELAKEPERIAIKQVWTGIEADNSGSVSPDGRYISYVDWETGDLAIYEITTGKKRRLTNKGSWDESDEYAFISRWSPDGKQIVYEWYNGNDYCDLRIIGLEEAKPRILYSNEEVNFTHPYDWSPDGEQILAYFEGKDGNGWITQIVLVSTANGAVRVLKTFDGGWPENMCFSPDGHFIVYDFPPKEDAPERDIFLLSADGSREIPLVEHPSHDELLGWAPDEENIIFSSDRNGTIGIWINQVVEGKSQGNPKLIKSGMEPIEPLGFTQKGSFYYGISQKMNNIYTAEYDPETGKIPAPPKKTITRFEGYNQTPDYSPDGKNLAYISRRFPLTVFPDYTIAKIGGNVLCIKSLETGKEREISLNLKVSHPRWSSEGHSVIVMDHDKGGYQQINTQTGLVTPVLTSDDNIVLFPPEPSHDGKTIFYVRRDKKAEIYQILVRDLESGTENEIYRSKDILAISLSPDGQSLAILSHFFLSEKKPSLKVMPSSGGNPRELCRFEEGIDLSSAGSIVWTADGKYILFAQETDNTDDPIRELFRIPAEGREPERLGMEVSGFLINLTVHPDGRQIAFSSSEQVDSEIWVMENLVRELEKINNRSE